MDRVKIGEKIFEIRLEASQAKLVDSIISNYPESNFKMEQGITINTNIQILGNQLLTLMDKIVNDGKMVKLLSYILIEPGKKFDPKEAEANEAVIEKIDFVSLFYVFGEAIKLYILKDSFGVLVN